MKRLAIIVITFGVGYGAHMLVAWYQSLQCAPEPSGQQTAIAGTDWIARTRGRFCEHGVKALTDIQIVKTDGAYPIIIAKGPDVGQARLDGTVPHQLTISAPKYADVSPQSIKIPGLQIIWHWND